MKAWNESFNKQIRDANKIFVPAKVSSDQSIDSGNNREESAEANFRNLMKAWSKDITKSNRARFFNPSRSSFMGRRKSRPETVPHF